MSWLFSQALVEEYSEGNCLDGEQCAPLSAMPTPHKFWHNGKTMDCSNLSQFGLTCLPLTESRGTALLTSYLAASRAKTSAQPARGQESTANALGCGVKWQELSLRFDPDTSSWKTAHCLFNEDLPWYSVTLPKWGMTRNGGVYRHPTLERPMKGTGSGLWPTPSVTTTGGPTGLGGGAGNREKLKRMGLAKMATGLLNPRWTEWLMGWSFGWTRLTPASSGASETDKFQEWLKLHGRY